MLNSNQSINQYYYTLHNVLLYKSNMQFWMFYGNFADLEDNPVNNINIYNVEGDNSTLAMQITWLKYQSR